MKIHKLDVPVKKVLVFYFIAVMIIGFLSGTKYSHNASVYCLEKQTNSLQKYKGLFLQSEFYKIQRDKKFQKKVAYWDIIKKYSKQYGIDPAIPATVQLLETGNMSFDKRVVAISKSGAIGLQQIMPFHAKANGYKEIDLYNPYINIKISCMLLSELCKKYNGDIDKILAQYNGGRREAIKVNNRRVPETRHYVKRGIERYTALSEM